MNFDEKWLAEYKKRGGKVISDTRGVEEAARKMHVLANAGISKAELTENMAKAAKAIAEAAPHVEDVEKPVRKYRNIRTEVDGVMFDSRHEAREYEKLRLRGLGGEFAGLARQVAFYLPGGVKYIADFVVLNHDGTFTVMDAKSDATRKNAAYRIKKRQMQACLGIEVEEI